METNFFSEYDAQHGVDLDPQPTQQIPVLAYNLEKPMALSDYIQLPDYVQKEYLTNLKRVYGAGAAQIGQLFGISTEDACELMRKSGVSFKGKRAANADERWAAFLGDYKPPEPAPRFTLAEAELELTAETPAAEPAPETPQNAQEAPEQEPVPVPPHTPKRPEEREPEPRPATPRRPVVTSTLRAFQIDLSGPMDAVLRRLTMFSTLVEDLPVHVTLCVSDQ